MTDPIIISVEQPVTEPRWGLGATILWGLLLLAIYSVIQFIVVIVYVAAAHIALTSEGAEAVMETLETNGTLLGIATCAGAMFGIPAILGVIKLKRGADIRSYLGLKRVSRRTMVVCIAMGCAFLAISDLINVALDRPVVPDVMRDTYASGNPLWLLWFSIIVVAPLFEEIFFRGFLFRGIEGSRIGVAGAILITSFTWAIIHIQYDAFEVATIFVLGILLGIVRWRTGSVLVPIALHMVNNLIAAIETALAVA